MMNILPTLLATLTGVPRYRPQFEWNNLLSYNAFRVYEYIFGRRYGIKAESSMDLETGTIYCYSLESVIVNFEVLLREKFKQFKKLSFVKIEVPEIVTNTGEKIPMGYRFAIALNTSGTLATTGPGTAVSNSYTVTGSDPAICVAWNGENAASKQLTTVTYNSVALSNPSGAELAQSNPTAGFDRWRRITYLQACSTGVNNITVNYSASHSVFNGYASSYSGVGTGTVDATTTGSASSASLTVNVTVTTANSWLVGYCASDANNVTASTGATARGDADGTTPRHLYDSNGAVGSGSQSMTATQTATALCWMAIAIPPVSASTVQFYPSLLTLNVG